MTLDETITITPKEDWTFSFEWALAQMRAWLEVYNVKWNWLSKQFMSVFIQQPDENSKMTGAYLCMKIVKQTENTSETTFVPRFPSNLDLLRWDWKIVE